MKLRLLCLHGYRQDAEAFKKRIGALRKRLKNVAEFEFLDGGVYVAPGDESGIAGEEGRAGGRGWWFSRADKYFRATHYSDYVEGFEESLDAVKKKVSECGPFDGVLGFSQGAAMAAMLCVLQERGELNMSFRFAVLVSAFRSRASQHKHFYEQPLAIPSLHVMGGSDQVVDNDMSEQLAAQFTGAVILRHEGGHFVPATADVAPGYTDFLKRFVSTEPTDAEQKFIQAVVVPKTNAKKQKETPLEVKDAETHSASNVENGNDKQEDSICQTSSKLTNLKL